MSPENSASARGKRRPTHACFNCKRKKTRCPGEKPTCSSCERLKQSCSYPPLRRPSESGRSEERLAQIEEKLNLILSGNLGSSNAARALEELSETHEKLYSPTPPDPETAYSISQPSSDTIDLEHSILQPGGFDIAISIGLYFKYCHRQPIWCFEREDVSNYGFLPEELTFSILALTSRFLESQEKSQFYSNKAKVLIMLRMANGTVELTTLESLCLLSYSSFMDGDVHLGQFYLGLGFQLCRSAMLDIRSAYSTEDSTTERKRRLFWSFQVLEQSYGRQTGLLSGPIDTWRPSKPSSSREHTEPDSRAPPLPRDELGCTSPSEPGVWNTGVNLGWVWSEVRRYVSDCSHNILKEPWRYDSTYARVLSDFMEIENWIPMCHRYDTVKFYERKVEEVKVNQDYWAPWLREQFTYHAIHTVLNHPFLYIVGAQHNSNLAIPNTFWRRSSELALLHSTWIVRMIDMVVDKQVPLSDPFFGHIAAIAATVHLYYCCAAAPKLRHKSNADFAKCRRFLKSFMHSSAACRALDRNLDRMTRIAASSESMDVEDWMPSKIYLSVPLMWQILQFNSMADAQEVPATGLLDASLFPNVAYEDTSEGSILEIIVATSPEISINTADGGQEAPAMSSKGPVRSGCGSSRGIVADEPYVSTIDNLSFNTTPWLYADSSQLVNIADMGFTNNMPSTVDESSRTAW